MPFIGSFDYIFLRCRLRLDVRSNHREVLCKFWKFVVNSEETRYLWNISILVKLQTSTSSKVVGLYLRRRPFLIRFQASSFSNTAKNTVISPNFLVWKFCGKVRIVLGDLPETMKKLCLSSKFPHQTIRWNYGIFCSVKFQVFTSGGFTLSKVPGFFTLLR